MAHRTAVLALAACTLFAACAGAQSPDAGAPDESAADATPPTQDAPPPGDGAPPGDAGLVGARPYSSRAPANYTADHAWPLVVLLHGYGASGSGQDLYLRLSQQVTTRGFLYAFPDGTVDADGKRFWNASTACCNFRSVPVDDVAYVTAILDDMSSRYRVDPNRVFLIGHSNGGFMAHRYACEHPERVAAIVSLAGAGPSNAASCAPSRTVAVLQVHGDHDAVISYEGGNLYPGALGAYPSAHTTVADWAARNGCQPALTPTGETKDLETSIAGAETTVAAHTGCRPGGAAELWTIAGGPHIPLVDGTFGMSALDWLFAHARTP